MDYVIKGIPAEGVETVWRFAEPFIKRALDHALGELSAQDIAQFCENRDMQLWMIVKGTRVVGAGATQVVWYPKKKVCRIVALAGTEFDQWMDYAHAYIEAWAISQKLDEMEAFVRKGFVPKLKSIGYRHGYCVMAKSLKG